MCNMTKPAVYPIGQLCILPIVLTLILIGNGCIIAISTIRLHNQWSVQDCINRFVALLGFSDGGLSIPTYFASLVTGNKYFIDLRS